MIVRHEFCFRNIDFQIYLLGASHQLFHHVSYFFPVPANQYYSIREPQISNKFPVYFHSLFFLFQFATNLLQNIIKFIWGSGVFLFHSSLQFDFLLQWSSFMYASDSQHKYRALGLF